MPDLQGLGTNRDTLVGYVGGGRVVAVQLLVTVSTQEPIESHHGG